MRCSPASSIPEKRDDSLKLMIESGLLVAFAVDGGCAPVTQAHAELRRVLAEGASPTKAVAALEEACARIKTRCAPSRRRSSP
jgi:hypothetical protein